MFGQLPPSSDQRAFLGAISNIHANKTDDEIHRDKMKKQLYAMELERQTKEYARRKEEEKARQLEEDKKFEMKWNLQNNQRDTADDRVTGIGFGRARPKNVQDAYQDELNKQIEDKKKREEEEKRKLEELEKKEAEKFRRENSELSATRRHDSTPPVANNQSQFQSTDSESEQQTSFVPQNRNYDRPPSRHIYHYNEGYQRPVYVERPMQPILLKTDGGGGDAVSALQPLLHQLVKGYESDKQTMKEMMEEILKKQRLASTEEANKTAQQLKEAMREMADLKRQMELEHKKIAHRERVELLREQEVRDQELRAKQMEIKMKEDLLWQQMNTMKVPHRNESNSESKTPRPKVIPPLLVTEDKPLLKHKHLKRSESEIKPRYPRQSSASSVDLTASLIGESKFVYLDPTESSVLHLSVQRQNSAPSIQPAISSSNNFDIDILFQKNSARLEKLQRLEKMRSEQQIRPEELLSEYMKEEQTRSSRSLMSRSASERVAEIKAKVEASLLSDFISQKVN